MYDPYWCVYELISNIWGADKIRDEWWLSLFCLGFIIVYEDENKDTSIDSGGYQWPPTSSIDSSQFSILVIFVMIFGS